MIVEPVPAAPRSRRRRLAARAGLAVPVLLLAAVIGAALLGESRRPPRPSLVAVVPAATPARRRRRTPSPSTATRRAPAATDLPDRARRAAPSAPWTTSSPSGPPGRWTRPPACSRSPATSARPNPPATCDPRAARHRRRPGAVAERLDVGRPAGPLCTRESILALVRWSLAGSEGFSGIGPHLHVVVPVGVQLPDGIERTTMRRAAGPSASSCSGGSACRRRTAAGRSSSTATRASCSRASRGRTALAVAPRPVIDRGLGDEPARVDC